MKKTLIFLGIISNLFLISCNKNEENTTNSKATEEKYNISSIAKAQQFLEEISIKTTFQESVLIFNTLSSQEKSDVWKLHLLQAKENLNLNNGQNELIDHSIEFISPDIFENPELPSTRGEMAQITAQSRVLFAELLRKQIFEDLDLILPVPAGGGGNGNGMLCECSTQSDWCGVGETGSNRSKCTLNKSCKNEDPTGCGTFRWYKCSGSCMIRLPN